MRSLTTRAAGLLILIGGIWGGLAPFVGPYFHFVLGPDKAWTWTSGRLWLSVIPGVVAVVAGLMLLRAGPRTGGRLGAVLAIAAGAWFAVGPDISQFWQRRRSAGCRHRGEDDPDLRDARLPHRAWRRHRHAWRLCAARPAAGAPARNHGRRRR